MAKSAGQLLNQGTRAAAYDKLVKALKESMNDVRGYLNQAGDDEHPVHKAMRKRLNEHEVLLVKLGESNGE